MGHISKVFKNFILLSTIPTFHIFLHLALQKLPNPFVYICILLHLPIFEACSAKFWQIVPSWIWLWLPYVKRKATLFNGVKKNMKTRSVRGLSSFRIKLWKKICFYLALWTNKNSPIQRFTLNSNTFKLCKDMIMCFLTLPQHNFWWICNLIVSSLGI